MDTSRHAGKLAIVTGAGSGIGRAVTVRLAAEGARVLACDRHEEGLAETTELAGGGVISAVVDVTDQGDIDRLLLDVQQVDILVNNAGIMDHFLPVTEVDDTTWDEVLAVNLTGAMRLARAVLPKMPEGGAIVAVGSEGSLRAGVAGVAYTSSKHGLIGLVKHIAFFYGPKGVRSNAVLPGGVNTGIGESAAPQSQWAMERAGVALASMAPMAQPEQIAAVISWLACDEASNVNGAVVTADGGWSAA